MKGRRKRIDIIRKAVLLGLGSISRGAGGQNNFSV
jgi:hypothetical protein